MDLQNKLLKDIETLRNDLEQNGMRLPPGLAGMFGEILVWKELKSRFESKGYEVKYFSGQRGADLLIQKGKKKINIEIKTSRLKDEGSGLWYGAALAIKGCKVVEHGSRGIKHPKKGIVNGDFCYFDFVIFVKLDPEFKHPKYYIFPRDYIWKHEKLLRNLHKRFTSSTHRIILSNGRKMPQMPKVQLKLILEMEKYKSKWSLIA
jgi:hypothetical protein